MRGQGSRGDESGFRDRSRTGDRRSGRLDSGRGDRGFNLVQTPTSLAAQSRLRRRESSGVRERDSRRDGERSHGGRGDPGRYGGRDYGRRDRGRDGRRDYRHDDSHYYRRHGRRHHYDVNYYWPYYWPYSYSYGGYGYYPDRYGSYGYYGDYGYGGSVLLDLGDLLFGFRYGSPRRYLYGMGYGLGYGSTVYVDGASWPTYIREAETTPRRERRLAAFESRLSPMLGGGSQVTAEFALGELALQGGDFHRAAAAFRVAAADADKGSAAWLALSIALAGAGRYEDAAAALRAAGSSRDTLRSIRVSPVDVFRRPETYGALLADLKDALEKDPTSPDRWLVAGYVHLVFGRHAEAAQLMWAAYGAGVDDPLFLQFLLEAEWRLRQTRPEGGEA